MVLGVCSILINISLLIMTKKISVIGGGSVGSALADAIAKNLKESTVVIGARDPEKTKASLAEKKLAHLSVEPKDAAIASSDVLILATPSVPDDAALEALAQSLGDVSGKSIIDATNPLTSFPDGLEVRWSQGTSGAEVLQKALPDSKVYKAFNTLGVEHMLDGAGKDMMYAGPDQEIADIVASVGYKPFYVGPIRYARNLEAIAELWIHCAIPPLPAHHWGRDWTFSISGKPEGN